MISIAPGASDLSSTAARDGDSALSSHPSTAPVRKKPVWVFADLLFFARPVLLGPVWTVYGAGAILAGGLPGLDLLFVTLVVAGVYVHNQITDIQSDIENRKLFLLPEGHITRLQAMVYIGVLWATGMLWATSQGGRGVLFIAAVALGVLYNGVRGPGWKSRPLPGLSANMLAHGTVTFLAGYTAVGGQFSRGLLLSVPYAFAVGAVYMATTLVDAGGDSVVGKRTFCVAYGPTACVWCIVGWVLAAAIVAAGLGDIWMSVACGISLLPAVALAAEPGARNAHRFAISAVSLLAIATAARWLFLFALAAVTFAGARLYYRRRFGLHYPRFGGA